jgi:hypothetical protein
MILAARLLLLSLVPGLFTACSTSELNPEAPLTPKTFPDAYTERVIEVADANRDGSITVAEWVSAGGNRRSFAIADGNRNGIVTRTEIRRIGSTTRVRDFTRTFADLNRDNRITRRELHSASGIRILRLDF